MSGRIPGGRIGWRGNGRPTAQPGAAIRNVAEPAVGHQHRNACSLLLVEQLQVVNIHVGHRHLLVLDLNGLGSGLLVLLHGPAHVEGISVPGIAVGEDGQVDATNQVVDPHQHLGKSGESGVR